MSDQNRMVFHRCTTLADELISQAREEDAEAVLRALQAYLDILPAFADGSCRATAGAKLNEVYELVRAKRAPKEARA